MQIARAAAAKALQDGTSPEPADQPGADEAPSPGQAARPPSSPHRADPALAFARLASVVRLTIALEARIAADGFAPARSPAPTHRRPGSPAENGPPDPRRPALERAVNDITQHHPRRTQLRRETLERLDLDLLADPDAETPVQSLFASVCEELGLDIDDARISDETLDFICPPKHGQPPLARQHTNATGPP
jgi:hypothetical protein